MPQKENYEGDWNCFCRRVFFCHLVSTGKKIKGVLSENDHVSINDIPAIKPEEHGQFLSEKFEEYLAQRLKDEERTEVTPWDITVALFHTLRSGFLLTFFFTLVDIVIRLGASVLLQMFLAWVSAQNYTSAYLMGLCLSFIFFINELVSHNSLYEGFIVSGCVRSCLISLMFKKIYKLTQFTVNRGEVGKMTNMISNDFNLIEMKAPYLFGLLSLPFAYFGFIIVIYFRIGVEGLLFIAIPLLAVPFQILIGHYCGVKLEQVNIHKDKRIKITSELIESIKHIKVSGWELNQESIINSIRKEQMSSLIKLSVGRALALALTNNITNLSCFVALYVRSLNGFLDDAIIYSCMGLSNFLRAYNFFGIMGLGFIFQIKVLFERFATIYNMQNIQMIEIKPDPQKHILFQGQESETELEDGEIQLSNFYASWKEDGEEPTLKNINLKIERGKFYGVYGKVGSGKSTFLQAILGQIPSFSGRIRRKGKISYFQQQPIIYSQTIKENIVFGRQFDEGRYKNAVESACLGRDLELFEDGENTLVGENGLTLSGGQKARMSLARALYEEVDIYLLDDPLSAVDAKVAQLLFTKTCLQMLKDKTIILVTHQTHFLTGCDRVVEADQGCLISHPPQVLKGQKWMQQHQEGNEVVLDTENKPVEKEEEDIEVTGGTYLRFFFFSNKYMIPLTILTFILCDSIGIAFLTLLSYYDEDRSGESVFGSEEEFWMVEGVLIGLHFVFLFIKYSLFSLVILNFTSHIHQQMLHSFIRSCNSFYDITPVGQLTNKFSNDIGVLDNSLIFTLIQAFDASIFCFVLMINTFIITPFFIIVVAVIALPSLLALYIWLKPVILESKQMDLKQKSPVFTLLTQTIQGLLQLRLFSTQHRYVRAVNQAIDRALEANLFFWFSSRLLGVYVSIIMNIVIAIGIFIGIAVLPDSSHSQSEIDEATGLYAVSVASFLFFLDLMQWCIRQIMTAESMMVSVQRCFAMIDVEHEKPIITDYDLQMGVALGGKEEGRMTESQLRKEESAAIVLENFSMRYRKELPLVLEGINLRINDGEKVGVVGRTGAGKSSIIQGLLRMYEGEDGSVYRIGGCDAQQLGVHTLRKRMSVIPQVPFIFHSSIRLNLDPFLQYTEGQAWQALEDASLAAYVRQLPHQMQTQVSNNSGTFSVGQKQLLCLSRALLRNARLVLLDEATSNVDTGTDRLLQQILRQKFSQSTVITIAHRLLTIADYDKVVVMDGGGVKEVGHPYQLYQQKGLFYELVKCTGSAGEQILKLAEQSYFGKGNASS